MDIVITARGQIIQNYEKKEDQSLDKDLAITISVREGEYVYEGQIKQLYHVQNTNQA